LLFGDSSNAQRKSDVRSLPIDQLVGNLDSLPFGRIGLVIDACFGGKSMETIPELPSTPDPVQKWRRMMASGYVEVEEGKPGECSKFANAFRAFLSSPPTDTPTWRQAASKVTDQLEGSTNVPIEHEFPGRRLDGAFLFPKKSPSTAAPGNKN
jgi:hypothetical protein